MKYCWGKKSIECLDSCDIRLRQLAYMMLERSDFDLTVICGYRGEKEQNEAYKQGKSKAIYGQSKHNARPSLAMDICPYPINWDSNDPRWQEMALNAMWCAGKLGIEITWGGTFNGLKDMPHIEIKEKHNELDS